MTPIDAGGDDEFMPGWYVAHSAPLNAIVVAQSGTNFASKSVSYVVTDIITRILNSLHSANASHQRQHLAGQPR